MMPDTSYLQDNASIWASPAMEEFTNGNVPFNGQWETFREHFKAGFETVNEAVNAKEKLHILWQSSLFTQSLNTPHYSRNSTHTSVTFQLISGIAFMSIFPLVSRTSSSILLVPL